MKATPKPGGALEVIGDTAEEYGVKLDGLSVLLGYMIGCEWGRLRPVPSKEDADVLDGSALREWLVTYFEATGRKKKRKRS